MTATLPDDRYELQRRLREAGLYVGAIDGIIGPKSTIALANWAKALPLDDPSVRPIDTVPAGWSRESWPTQRYDALVKEFGAVGSNMGRCEVPFDLVLDWDKTKTLTWFTCHEKVAKPLEWVFKKLYEHYGPEKIVELGLNQFSGCLNIRKMRGGSSWSMHAWAVAWDMDGDRNRLHEDHTTARFARPEYEPMWRIVEEVAWSLGREKDYDWMHSQFPEP